MAAGHPEIEYPGQSRLVSAIWFPADRNRFRLTGIEVTTGPLGQGIANAVGLAIASKHLAATYNKDDLKVVDNRIWCFTGDGCLQEGVGQEGRQALASSKITADASSLAVSIAGHLGLDNLILIYDNNSVTVDGSIDSCFTEDTSAKLAAQGWHVIDVQDGSNDVSLLMSLIRLLADLTLVHSLRLSSKHLTRQRP